MLEHLSILALGLLFGLLFGYARMESFIHNKTRKACSNSHKCYACPDCPNNCPLDIKYIFNEKRVKND